MSVEHGAHYIKREGLYQDLEKRMGIINDLRVLVENTPSIPNKPNLGRVKVQLAQDEVTTVKFLQYATSVFPDDAANAEKATRAHQASKGDPNSDQVREYQELRSMEGVRFFLSLKEGLNIAFEGRRNAHLAVAAKGVSPKNWNSILPKEYAYLGTQILQVIPGKFSISLIVRSKSFNRYIKSRGSLIGSDLDGFHASSTILNFQREDLSWDSGFSVLSKQEAATIEGLAKQIASIKFREDTIDHEDTHALIEGFLVEEDNPEFLLHDVEQEITTLEDVRDEDTYVARLRDISYNLKDLVNSSHEEFIIEFVRPSFLKGLRRKHPFGGTLHFMDEEKQRLEQILTEDPNVKRKLGVAINRLDSQVLVAKLNEWYQRVEASCPDKIRDLEAALILLPPTQRRHIDKLIDRWTADKRKIKKVKE